MPYSIGGNQLQVINGDVNGALANMGTAYGLMSNGLNKIADAPFQIKNVLQDNADARYSEALNRYSNDPEGLAKALQNGEIDTSLVRAETLNQTQGRLKNIAENKAINYLQGRAEASNNWFDTHGEEYLKAVGDSQQGKVKELNDWRSAVHAPAEVQAVLAKLDPEQQQNFLKQLQAQNAAQALMQRKYDDQIAANGALFDLYKIYNDNGVMDNPNARRDLTSDVINGKVTGVDTLRLLSLLKRDPTALQTYSNFISMGLYGQGNQGGIAYDDGALKKNAPQQASGLSVSDASRIH